MVFKRAVSHLMRGLLLSMLIMAGSAAYWAVSGDLSLMQRDDNPRLMEAEAAIRRGAIYSRDNTLLAETVIDDESGRLRRIYHDPAFYSALGYYSLRYGTGGTEAAFNDVLRGDTLPVDLRAHFEQDFLHRPQTGSDVRLTLDANIQATLAAAMDGYSGAAVMISAPRGELLGMVSVPTFDPNQLNEQWEDLVQDEGKPFFNRVLQGQYQPGTALMTPLMAQALLSNTDLSQSFTMATEPVIVDETVLVCAIEPDRQALTLLEAYGYACPRPFEELAMALGGSAVNNIFANFRLSESPQLDTATSRRASDTSSNSANRADNDANRLTADALGQSVLTVSPLRMATIAAAVINEGNAPVPQSLGGTRAPGTDTWQNTAAAPATEAIMTSSVARRLRELMVGNVTTGGLSEIIQSDVTIGGHSALAYAGDSAQAWFIGFSAGESGRGVAIAIVLEDSRDAAAAASIGAAALEAAQTLETRSSDANLTENIVD